MKTLKSLDQNGNILYISSLSKIIASDLRIGWIIGPNSVIERLSDAKQQVDFGHGSHSQWIANNFIESSEFESHIQHLVKQLDRRSKQIDTSLQTFLNTLHIKLFTNNKAFLGDITVEIAEEELENRNIAELHLPKSDIYKITLHPIK
ncbi:aminotransferase class I/II-fold pyridoxal phosphate-dependent enzyme [Halalkalibacter krulwichiae]|uniref:HTH-type transcriptional regulator NorG n=1 Tax=Halalkalibacter krulwichiae TaxID=199441 RepID=A0A1X9MD03_9BACI|nr:aminotransferase class I/II-fold pyridoxal phosphate-dependent enzyme [Halalkalibacter krulwichiae]ARK31298.1 HTH-type transcriptional regulator NorG [Halalkalibacter krulwichiae]